jgi:hypothetical protein
MGPITIFLSGVDCGVLPIEFLVIWIRCGMDALLGLRGCPYEKLGTD